MKNNNDEGLKNLCNTLINDAIEILSDREYSCFKRMREFDWIFSNKMVSDDNMTFLHCCRFLDIDHNQKRIDILKQITQ